MTTKEFIQKAKAVHGDKYDYSKVEYVNTSTKVCIICKKHGEYWQLPSSHLKGHGCIECRRDGNTKYTKDQCLEAAKKCHSRVEFYKKHPGLSLAAKYHGWYEECCEHMGKRGNKQRLIYAYEFTLYQSVYIGLTFNIEVRNKRHQKEGAVFEFANQHGVNIPEPKILTDLMLEEQAATEEGVWVDYYRNHGWRILNKIRTGSLGGQEKLDYNLQAIEESMKGYKSLTDWSADYKSYREYIRQHNLDYLLDKHFPNRMVKKYDNYEECKKTYDRCSSLTELKLRFPGALAAAKRHGWHMELSHLCRASVIKWTREKCMEIIAQHKTLQEFKTAHNGAYQMIRKNGWIDLLQPLERQLHAHYKFTIEQIKDFCQEAGSYETLKANHPEVLSYCWHNAIDLYTLNGWTRSHFRPIRLLKEGVVVATFTSAKEAAKYVGVRDKNLGRYIDKGVEYHGYIWETNK